MDKLWKEVIWKQFSAAIDMFGNSLAACPDELWTTPLWNDPKMPGFSDFWYVAYHTLFWFDLYLTGREDGFLPPAPFTLDELDPRGVLPECVYSRDELLAYLAHCRQKCRLTIDQLTDDQARRDCYFPWSHEAISFAELLLDNMRHVQEHGAQLRMLLGQEGGISSSWIARTGDNPSPA